MYVDEGDGTVQHDDSACIGCQACVRSCPYGAPQYRVDLNISQKCDGCYDLRALGLEPEMCIRDRPYSQQVRRVRGIVLDLLSDTTHQHCYGVQTQLIRLIP